MNEFLQRFTLRSVRPCSLPFTVGGVTQHGPHDNGEQNNQDALSLVVQENCIVAVCCDGCSGSDPAGGNLFSYKECGAQIISTLAARHTSEILRITEPDIDLVREVESRIADSLYQMIELIAGDSLPLKKHYSLEMFMSTFTVAVVTSTQWCIFHLGDGYVLLNDQIEDLNDKSSGSYLANRFCMTSGDFPHAEILASGQTDMLESIIIGSDGIRDLNNRGLLGDMAATLDPKMNYQPGFNLMFLREFRKRVSRPFESMSSLTMHDDRSLIMIRRIPNQINHTSNVSTRAEE